MDYVFVSSTFVIVVVLSATSFSRTVQPITYSFGTVNDGESESSIQYGSYTAGPYDADYDTPSKSLSKHPSVLAHHYYDPPTETSWPSENDTFAASTSPPSTTKRSRKKNEYVPRVSYIHKATTTEATTIPAADPTSTESIMSPVRVRKKGRWLRVRNEIPVTEDPVGETPPASNPQPSVLVELNRMRVNKTLQSNNSNHSRPANGFGRAQNSSLSLRTRPKLEVPKNGTLTTPRSIKANQQRWNYMRSTSTTENPAHIRYAKNSSFVTEERFTSAHPIQVLHYTTDANTERELDFVTLKPTPKYKYNQAGRNVDQLYIPPKSNIGQTYNAPNKNIVQSYNPLNRQVSRPKDSFNKNADQSLNLSNKNIDQQYSPPNRNVEQPLISSKNAGHFSKIDASSKTTPVPKYKEAYFRKPLNRPRITPATLTHSSEAQQFVGASNQEKERVKYENTSLTTEQPQNYPEAKQETSDLEDESAEQPGTHHESLTYSDTEKTEKTEEILRDMEYPEEEDEEESETDEEVQDPTEENPSKILQKPMRYAYSSDQNISESQTHHEPQNENSQPKKKEGGGEKHRSAHHKSEGDKAEEDYESAVEYDKGKKGHSDKENRKNHQEEERGKKKKILEEDGHQERHQVSSKGEKGTLFGESGSHKKGHSTKGKIRLVF